MPQFFHTDPKKFAAQAMRNSGLLNAIAEFMWVAQHHPDVKPDPEWGPDCPIEEAMLTYLGDLLLAVSEEIDDFRRTTFDPDGKGLDLRAQPGAEPGEYEEFLKRFEIPTD